jgi:hypothetical protein
MKATIKVLLSLIAIAVILNGATMVWVRLVTNATSYSIPAFIGYLVLFSIDCLLLMLIISIIIAIIIDLARIIYAKVTKTE